MWYADRATSSSSYPFSTLASQSTIQWMFCLSLQELSCRSDLGYFMLIQPALTGRNSKRECLGLPGMLPQASEQSLSFYCDISALHTYLSKPWSLTNRMFLADVLSWSSRRACSSTSASFGKVFVLFQFSDTTQQSRWMTEPMVFN